MPNSLVLGRGVDVDTDVQFKDLRTDLVKA